MKIQDKITKLIIPEKQVIEWTTIGTKKIISTQSETSGQFLLDALAMSDTTIPNGNLQFISQVACVDL
jgi:hypothetical protein